MRRIARTVLQGARARRGGGPARDGFFPGPVVARRLTTPARLGRFQPTYTGFPTRADRDARRLKQLLRTTPPRELVRRVRPRSERVQVSAKARSCWLPSRSSPHRCRGIPRRSFHPPSDRDALARAPSRSIVLPFPRGRRGIALDGRAAGRATGPTEVGPAEPGRCCGSPRAPGGLSFARRVSPPARVEARAAAVPRRAGCPTPGSAGGDSSPPPTTENWTFLAIVR